MCAWLGGVAGSARWTGEKDVSGRQRNRSKGMLGAVDLAEGLLGKWDVLGMV